MFVSSLLYLITASIASLLTWLGLRGVKTKLEILTLGLIQFLFIFIPLLLKFREIGTTGFRIFIFYFPSILLVYIGLKAVK